MHMRKITAAVVGSVLALTGLTSSTLFISPVAAGGKIVTTVPNLGLDLRENSELGRMPSILFGTSNVADQRTWLMCKDVNDPICTSATNISGQINLDICTADSHLDCIADVWAVDSAGRRIQGIFQKSMPDDPRYNIDENVSINLPKSHGVGAVWKIPGVLNSAGLDTYFVAAQDSVGMQKAAGQSIRASGNLGTGSIIAGIIPVQETPGTFQLLTATDAAHGGFAWGSNGTQYAPDKTPCAATELNLCEANRGFPVGYRFGMTIHFGQKRPGWFHGRLHTPAITTKPWNDGEEVSIEAEPVLVPSLNFLVPNAQIPAAARALVFSGIELGMKGDGSSDTQISENLSGPYTLDLVSTFAPAYNNKATATDSYWSFKTLNENSDSIQKCSGANSDLAGLVTTNALAYAAGPPTFDKASGSLVYKVASPHYQADGQVASGTYDLSIRGDVARCIYGFSKAPIKAEVSIISQDGNQQIATTSLTEKDGWLYLTANGFGYSNPTIKVKLSQDAPAPAPTISSSPAPSATPTSVASVPPQTLVAKKTTITCIKGKLTKSVTAVKPTCPTGYKKK